MSIEFDCESIGFNPRRQLLESSSRLPNTVCLEQNFASLPSHPDWGGMGKMVLGLGIVLPLTFPLTLGKPAIAQVPVAPVSIAATTDASTSAKILFVNPTLGHDQSDGSQRSPLRTITRALQIAQPNTVILLSPGVYSAESGEVFPLQLENGVALQGDLGTWGQGIVIRGGGPVPPSVGAQRNVTISAQSGTTLAGVTVVNPYPQGYGLWLPSAQASILNNTFHAVNHDGILSQSSDAAQIQGNVFSLGTVSSADRLEPMAIAPERKSADSAPMISFGSEPPPFPAAPSEGMHTQSAGASEPLPPPIPAAGSSTAVASVPFGTMPPQFAALPPAPLAPPIAAAPPAGSGALQAAVAATAVNPPVAEAAPVAVAVNPSAELAPPSQPPLPVALALPQVAPASALPPSTDPPVVVSRSRVVPAMPPAPGAVDEIAPDPMASASLEPALSTAADTQQGEIAPTRSTRSEADGAATPALSTPAVVAPAPRPQRTLTAVRPNASRPIPPWRPSSPAPSEPSAETAIPIPVPPPDNRSSRRRPQAASPSGSEEAIAIPVPPPERRTPQPRASAIAPPRSEAASSTTGAVREVTIVPPRRSTVVQTIPPEGIPIPVPPPEASRPESSPPRATRLGLAPTRPLVARGSANPGDTFELLPVPSVDAPLGNVGRLATANGPRNTSPSRGRSQPVGRTEDLRYRVVVESNNEQDWQRMRSLIPGAFRTIRHGRVFLQAGAYSDRANAEETAQLLIRNGLEAVVQTID